MRFQPIDRLGARDALDVVRGGLAVERLLDDVAMRRPGCLAQVQLLERRRRAGAGARAGAGSCEAR